MLLKVEQELLVLTVPGEGENESYFHLWDNTREHLMRLNITGAQSLGVGAVVQCGLSRSASMMVSSQTPLLDNIISPLDNSF